MKTFDLFWAPTGSRIATVQALTARAAIRKTPAPHSKFKGEVFATEVTVFTVSTGEDDNGLPTFDEFKLSRVEAAAHLREHRRLGSYIERRPAGCYYVEPREAVIYLVHYWLDDVKRTPGTCKTDHRLAIGETFYAGQGQGRATVRSCRELRETPVYVLGGNVLITKVLA